MVAAPMPPPEVTAAKDGEGGAKNGGLVVDVTNRDGEELFATPGDGRWAVTLNEVFM